MLYVRLANGQQRQELAKEIEKRLADRAMIPIRAKLLSLIRDVAATPWAYPACITTEECKTYWREMNKIAGWSAIPSDRTGDAVSGLGLSALLKRLPQMAFGSALLNQFGGQSKDYYDSYARRLSDELALRGVPPSTLE